MFHSISRVLTQSNCETQLIINMQTRRLASKETVVLRWWGRRWGLSDMVALNYC